MKSTVGAATLLIVSAAFLAVGWIGLTDPVLLLAPLGIGLPSLEAADRATAYNEMRATYGGMHVAMGLFFFGGVFLRQVRGIALTVALVYLTGVVTGRGVSVALDGPPAPAAWILLATEVVALAMVASALVKRWRLARAAAAPARPAPPPEPAPAG